MRTPMALPQSKRELEIDQLQEELLLTSNLSVASSKWSPNNKDSICSLSLKPFHDCQHAARFSSLQFWITAAATCQSHLQLYSLPEYQSNDLQKGKIPVCFVLFCFNLVVSSFFDLAQNLKSFMCLYLSSPLHNSSVHLPPSSFSPSSFPLSNFWNRLLFLEQKMLFLDTKPFDIFCHANDIVYFLHFLPGYL